ncbi:hypothetical protein RFI_01999, partial [Reticulomyxa filosa]
KKKKKKKKKKKEKKSDKETTRSVEREQQRKTSVAVVQQHEWTWTCDDPLTNTDIAPQMWVPSTATSDRPNIGNKGVNANAVTSASASQSNSFVKPPPPPFPSRPSSLSFASMDSVAKKDNNEGSDPSTASSSMSRLRGLWTNWRTGATKEENSSRHFASSTTNTNDPFAAGVTTSSISSNSSSKQLHFVSDMFAKEDWLSLQSTAFDACKDIMDVLLYHHQKYQHKYSEHVIEFFKLAHSMNTKVSWDNPAHVCKLQQLWKSFMFHPKYRTMESPSEPHEGWKQLGFQV